MKKLAVSAAALVAAIGLAGTANAADLARRAPAPPVKAPYYVAPVFTWTGFYAGVNLGYGWADGSGTLTAPGGSGPVTGSGNGVLGGGQIGYNWQTGPLVLGLETDFQGTGANGTVNATVPGTVYAGTTHTPWFGTIRGRVGYAVDRWLFYVTGGGAYARNELTGTATTGGVTTPFSTAANGWGYTVGGGIEAKLAQNWSVKGEYLYIGGMDSVPVPPGTTVSGNTDTHIIRVGVNYHF